MEEIQQREEDQHALTRRQPDANTLDLIRTETVLSKLPVHNLAKKGRVDIRIVKITPAEELGDRLRVGRPRIRVPDRRGKEFDEAPRRGFAGALDDDEMATNASLNELRDDVRRLNEIMVSKADLAETLRRELDASPFAKESDVKDLRQRVGRLEEKLGMKSSRHL